MAKVVCTLVVCILLTIPVTSMAKKTVDWKIVTPSENYELVSYKLSDYFSYRIDPKTCLCFAQATGVTEGGLTEISCKKLAKIAELVPYIEKCE